MSTDYSVTLNTFEYRVSIDPMKPNGAIMAETTVLSEYAEILSETWPHAYFDFCHACIVSMELFKSSRLGDGDGSAEIAIERAGIECTCDDDTTEED